MTCFDIKRQHAEMFISYSQ